MGLAEPRKRGKLSHDPNNTKWTRDTTGFGHKIMSGQGWQPGDILGAKGAPHAEFHTAANASHIRVVLKDDNLGLGAKRGSGLAQGECTGLDAFQSLLGRLNGGDVDELEKEQKSREDLKRAVYTEQRWGSIRFVKGGFLVGDKIQELVEMEEDRIRRLALNSSSMRVGVTEGDTIQSSRSNSDEARDLKARKKRRKEEKRRLRSTETALEKIPVQQEPEETLRSATKKPKKKRKDTKVSPEESDDRTKTEVGEERKSKKKKRKAGAQSAEVLPVPGGEPANKPSRSHTPSRATSPKGPPCPPRTLLVGRHALRSRNIAQKRLAVMDTASLNQIFMMKQNQPI